MINNLLVLDNWKDKKHSCRSLLRSCDGYDFPAVLQFIFSTALDGKIKAWLYDNLGSRVDYDAPGRWCTTLAYSADGKRSLTAAEY